MSRDPGRSEPFATLVPKTDENLRALTDCYSSDLALPALACLYLRAGKYMPTLAKTRGAFIGLCDEQGFRVASTVATHIGFTAGDEFDMESPPPTVTGAVR
jgi:hypothetical protein